MRIPEITRPIRMRALVGFAAFGAFWGTWGASLPRVQLEAGVTDAQLGTALLWVGVGALLSIRYVGGLTDRGDQWVLPVSIATLAVAGAVPAFVHGVVVLSIALLVLGICAGAVDSAINAAAVRAETDGQTRAQPGAWSVFPGCGRQQPGRRWADAKWAGPGLGASGRRRDPDRLRHPLGYEKRSG